MAAVNQCFQYPQVNSFICPLALAKEGGGLVLFPQYVDLCLCLFNGVIAPPAAQRSKLHRGAPIQQQLPKILFTYLFKHLAHVVVELRRDALVHQVSGSTGNQGIVLQHKAMPEAEHIILDGVQGLTGSLLPIGSLLLHDPQADEILDVAGADVGILADLA